MSDPIARLNQALEGRYAIERELGQGGMATVYLAEDLRHERKVALKVLKPELAAVVGAERFLAEIKTTANLQHPHILPLFDSGEADSFLFYVMPYVEGETLRERMQRDKQLPVEEAVSIATSVAHALQHAHDRGVIHRDIKPANILMQDGQPVVADFGIALAVGAAGGSRLTETGLSVGTPYYMSPEQATGDQSLGPSSDTYALGAVLYEMLVGDPPYMGSTAQAVLGQIISGVPVSATAKRQSIPANVDAAIRKALEKLPADRFKSAAGFAAALADPSFRLAGAAAGSVAGAGPWKLVAAAMAVVAVASLGGLGWALTRPEPPKRVDRLSLVLPAEPLATGGIQLLPDGSGLVYRAPNASGNQMLWHRSFADLTATPIRGTENTSTFFDVSGDPPEVTFTVSSTIRAVPLLGGPGRPLADEANCCAFLAEDGFFHFLGADGGAKRVPRAGGPVEVVAALETGEAFRLVSDVLPGGRHGLLNVFRSGTDTDVRVIDLETLEVGDPILVGHQAAYFEPGVVIYVTGEGTIMAAAFDPGTLAVQGFPVPLVEALAHVNTYAVAFSTSETGDLLYRTSASGTELSVTPMWVDRDGSTRPVDADWSFTGDQTNTSLNLSPDGSRLAVSYPRDGTIDIWIKALDTGPEQRLTFEGSINRRPMWSPDGSMITFVSSRTTPSSVWERRADGSAPARQVFANEQTIQEALYSPDGQHLVIKVGAVPTDLMAVPIEGDGEPIPLLTTEFNEYNSAISPDGRWIAYVSDESGRSEVYVRPFPDVGSGLWQVSSDGGRSPLWAHNGEELFYRSLANELVSVRYTAEPTFAMLGQEVLFSMAPYLNPNGRPQYTISPDDQRFIMLRLEAADDEGVIPAEVIYVRNFIEEVRARLEIGR